MLHSLAADQGLHRSRRRCTAAASGWVRRLTQALSSTARVSRMDAAIHGVPDRAGSQVPQPGCPGATSAGGVGGSFLPGQGQGLQLQQVRLLGPELGHRDQDQPLELAVQGQLLQAQGGQVRGA